MLTHQWQTDMSLILNKLCSVTQALFHQLVQVITRNISSPCLSGVYADASAQFSVTVSCGFSLWVFKQMISHQGIQNRKKAVITAAAVT